MRITVESTTKVVEVNGVPGRIWEGHTESGIRIHCMITGIAVAVVEDQSQFEAELNLIGYASMGPGRSRRARHGG